MDAIDDAHDSPPRPALETKHTRAIVLGTVLASFALVVASLLFDSGSGWNAASDLVARLSVVLFVAALVVEPLASLFPSRATQAAAQERGALVLAFMVADVMALACLLMPGGAPLKAPAMIYCLLTGAILVVLLFSRHPASKRLLGGPAWRSIKAIAFAYFWVVFALQAANQLLGPDSSMYWPGFALLLLVSAVLVRVADAFSEPSRVVAQKVG